MRPVLSRIGTFVARASGKARDPASGASRPSTVLDPWEAGVVERARPYTVTSPERLVALMDATAYVVRRGIPGALVECGVWRGGSVLTMIDTLQHLGVTDREVWLYDTFEGMTRPGETDTSPFEEEHSALTSWNRYKKQGRRPWDWMFRPEIFSFQQVQDLIYSTNYPRELIHFVVGPVEWTLPSQAPPEVSLLRLDTDWYQSTRHELVHLYPRLSAGGVLIIDDYGHWEGARRAVDEYFASEARPLLLARIDYTGRLGVKVEA